MYQNPTVLAVLLFHLLFTLATGDYGESSSTTIAPLTPPYKVMGSCSRPYHSPHAKIRFASDEKIRFSENETVYFLCQENQFPHHVQKRVCRHGSWHGPPARCGKNDTIQSILCKSQLFQPNRKGCNCQCNQIESI